MWLDFAKNTHPYETHLLQIYEALYCLRMCVRNGGGQVISIGSKNEATVHILKITNLNKYMFELAQFINIIFPNLFRLEYA